MTPSTGPVVNWADVASRTVDAGPIGARWTNLGQAAGTVDTGLRRIEIDPGRRSTPVHTHAAEEEIFFVLAGSGLSYQDGKTYEVGAGDCIVHLPGAAAHTLIAGAAGLDVLAFSDRRPPESAFLPRAGLSWLGQTWVKAGEGPHPFAQEVAAGELEMEPAATSSPSIASVDTVEALTIGRGSFGHVSRDLARAAGSRRVGLRHVELAEGKMSWPLHCHSGEEEIFVMLAGDATFILGDDEHPLRPGDVVARPAGQGVAHAVRGGVGGATYLAFGQRDPRSATWYPRSNKISIRGLGVVFRVEPVGYWDGEA